ncbi:MAG: xanthine dehydrogenase family protein molybdopterin-binding subunit [Desulfobacteraceae bacterium]|jgi:carbon-monoxide dehydrogenase large subunit
MSFKYIGKSFEKTDGYAKVTGAAQYVADIKLPRMLHAQILRPEYAHARIKSIDMSGAENSEGVYRVVTGQNCDIFFGAAGFFDQSPIAVEKVRHIGEPVAVVIADTIGRAKRALARIKVEYDPLPILLDPIEAANNKEILIHEDLGNYRHFSSYFPEAGTNIFHHYRLRKGDVNSGFEEADVNVEGEFEFPLSSHSALEPHGVICRWQGKDRVEIWASSQAPFLLQEVVADMFEIPHANVRVHIPYLGGGFGGKSDVTIEPMIAYAARFVPGYAVRFVCSRKEVMTSTVLGRGMKARAKLGAKRDGTFTAFQAELYFSDGAFGDTATNIVTVAGHNCVGPYAIEHCHVDAYGVYTNTPPVGAYRGYGHPEGCFVSERLVDLMARKLEVSPLELRRKNFLCEGKRNSLGETIRDDHGNLFKCLENVANVLFGEPMPKQDARYLYGRGVASMMKSPKGAPNASTCCHMKFCADGSVHVNLSGVDMGQGAQQAMRQIAAEALKMPPERISVYHEIDTQHSPWDWMTVASMFTYRGGNAVIKTAEKAIRILKENGSIILKVKVEDLDYDGEYVFVRNDPNQKLAVKDLVRGYSYENGLTVGEVAESTAGDRLPEYVAPDPKFGMGKAGGTWTFGCQGCELRVDKKTGEVIIDKFISSFDVGRVISPQMIRGQTVGGVVMGIGQTLKEKVEFSEDGKMTNASWVKYKMPRIEDIPGKQEAIFVETPEIRGPYGARCVAEHPMVAVSPTILSALFDATGHDFFHIPVTPDEIMAVIGGDV